MLLHCFLLDLLYLQARDVEEGEQRDGDVGVEVKMSARKKSGIGTATTAITISNDSFYLSATATTAA